MKNRFLRIALMMLVVGQTTGMALAAVGYDGAQQADAARRQARISNPVVTPSGARALYVREAYVPESEYVTPVYASNSEVMVPLRVVATHLGYTVSWDSTNNTAKVEGSVNDLYFKVGSADVVSAGKLQVINLDNKETYKAVCEIKNGSLYVPAKAFEAMMNDVDTTDRMVSITPAKAYIQSSNNIM